MSKMLCTCGRLISDSAYPSPTEGWVLRQQDKDSTDQRIQAAISSFLLAKEAGERDAWIHRRFSAGFPTSTSDASVIMDVISAETHTLSMAECEQCGRLWLQHEPGANIYRSYAPDVPGYAGALRSSDGS